MRFVCISRPKDGTRPEDFLPHLDAEVRAAWQNHSSGIYRDAYIRQDLPGVVLMLDADTLDAARQITDALPLSKAGLISFQIIPIGPFTNWEMLFTNP
ncbi:MAG: hypothetical protein Q4G24_14640 [Paracoccus sp. (in: a-proteobacteria)]|uniref:hypothetical protein n=1 Tax=Paracoccus sp. TaxID=267 RepID=UPI0026DF9EB1|nr:hypothetical protein [Paracoccus sp. (in: a-proteobacteria)]MDO5622694.1 hypothetical protein [Paracoccus sp. (in: a-proteobacteria)]